MVGPVVEQPGTAERWGAASGFAALVLSGAALAFERGGPPVGAGDLEIARFFTANRDALVTQSLLFITGSAALLWWFGSLRAFLLRVEGAPGRLSALAFGAGLTFTALNLLAQAFQLGLALQPSTGIPPALLGTALAVFAIANLPLAVLLAAVAVATFRKGAFPRWLGWLTVVAAAAAVALTGTVAVEDGPWATGGAVNGLLYLGFVGWLAATAIVLFRRLRP